jgi:Family of unknown function (DUF6695)
MSNNNATIVALAWPDTKAVQEGKWYDTPCTWLGFIKDEHWTTGHAAFLLIDNNSGKIEYFDFGRYHTPLKYGRVRDKYTDPDVTIKHHAIIEDGVVVNLEEILLERYQNKACHGDGRLTASVVKNINYDKAYAKVKAEQEREAIPYGPFELKGTTCSRLVAKVVLKSTDDWLTKLMILVPYTISATPRSNNKVLNDCCHFYEVKNGEIAMKKSKFHWFKKLFNANVEENIKLPANNIGVEFI